MRAKSKLANFHNYSIGAPSLGQRYLGDLSGLDPRCVCHRRHLLPAQRSPPLGIRLRLRTSVVPRLSRVPRLSAGCGGKPDCQSQRRLSFSPSPSRSYAESFALGKRRFTDIVLLASGCACGRL